ncbi:MAG TPA: YoaK family protein [Polyangiaceae bacterium]
MPARHESTGLALGARDKLRAAVLSGVAGYIDAAGLVSVVALFPAHITGELVSEAVALSTGHHEAGPSRLWMLPVFIAAVAVAALMARLQRERGRPALPLLLLLVALGLGFFAASGVLTLLYPELPPALFSRVGSGCAVAAMGFQNALMREALSGSAPTTFMTGNLTQLVIELVEHLFALSRPVGVWSDVQRSVSRSRMRTAAIALTCFLGSAAAGAWLTRAVGALSAILPSALVAWLSWQAFRERPARAVISVPAAPNPIGMRRPTPIQRPFHKHPRPESGTRFKAVRPVEEQTAAEQAADHAPSAPDPRTKAG